MFNIEEFSDVLQKISDSYNSISDFSEASEVNRTYLSKYINKKLDAPPSPKVLMKIANNSNNIITYEQLMEMCGYITTDSLSDISEAKATLDYETMLKKLNLTPKERTLLRTFELDFDKMDKKGISLDDIKNMLYKKIDLLPSEEYNINKLKNGIQLYILSVAATVVINEIYKLRAENDTAFNYLDALDKIMYLENDAQTIFNKGKKKNENSNVFPLADTPISVPVLGKISAGLPVLAIENIEGYEFAPSSYIKEGFDYFYLRVNRRFDVFKVQ